MLAVFFYGTAPREYLHDLFANHTDTVDHTYKKGESGISPKHTHCSFLTIDFGAFLFTEKQVLFFATLVHQCKWLLPVYHFRFASVHNITSLRGPPAADHLAKQA
jgi:hypothetical protein